MGDKEALTEKKTPPVVLTIAGFDPSSGAGVTADVRTAAAHGCYAVSCITALTVQSTGGVRSVAAVDGELVTETLEELAADLEIAAVITYERNAFGNTLGDVVQPSQIAAAAK